MSGRWKHKPATKPDVPLRGTKARVVDTTNTEKMAVKIARILKPLDEKEQEAMKKLVIEIIRRDGPVYADQRRIADA